MDGCLRAGNVKTCCARSCGRVACPDRLLPWAPWSTRTRCGREAAVAGRTRWRSPLPSHTSASIPAPGPEAPPES